MCYLNHSLDSIIYDYFLQFCSYLPSLNLTTASFCYFWKLLFPDCEYPLLFPATYRVLFSFYVFLKSFLILCLTCWFGSITTRNRRKLEQAVRLSSRIAGTNLNGLTDLYKVRKQRPFLPTVVALCLQSTSCCLDVGQIDSIR